MNHRVSNALTALLVGLLVLFAVAQAFAAPMPWKLFNEESMLQSNVFARPSVCQTTDVGANITEIFVAGFVYEGATYIMAYSTGNHHIVFTYTPAGAEIPTEIGFGVVDMETPGMHNVIPPLNWQPFVLGVNNNVCNMLHPRTT